jgi:hypothetical protein
MAGGTDKSGELLWGPRHGLEKDFAEAPTLCCDEPRDDTGDHDENRALGH